MADVHSFDVALAKEYGINAAVLFRYFSFWIEKNAANGTNEFNGETWTYNSIQALTILFPYMSAKTIRATIQKMLDADLLVKGNHNARAFDRTAWYALGEKGKSICRKGQFHLPKRANAFALEGKPIPYSYTDSNTDITLSSNDDSVGAKQKKGNRFAPPTVEEVTAYCRERKNGVDAERFVDYYSQQGWKLSNGNPMKDWQAAVRNWERREPGRASEKERREKNAWMTDYD